MIFYNGETLGRCTWTKGSVKFCDSEITYLFFGIEYFGSQNKTEDMHEYLCFYVLDHKLLHHSSFKEI